MNKPPTDSQIRNHAKSLGLSVEEVVVNLIFAIFASKGGCSMNIKLNAETTAKLQKCAAALEMTPEQFANIILEDHLGDCLGDADHAQRLDELWAPRFIAEDLDQAKRVAANLDAIAGERKWKHEWNFIPTDRGVELRMG